MDTKNATHGLGMARLIVVVERHLQSELGLLEKLDELNQTLKVTLEAAGSRGLAASQTNQLNLMADNLSQRSEELKCKRQKTLSAINSDRGIDQPQLSIREFVQSLDTNNSTRLEKLRMTILDRLIEVHATLVGNQAVMFYSFDFYRKMVAGLLDSDLDDNQYSMNGQASGVKAGNLYRKAC